MRDTNVAKLRVRYRGLGVGERQRVCPVSLLYPVEKNVNVTVISDWVRSPDGGGRAGAKDHGVTLVKGSRKTRVAVVLVFCHGVVLPQLRLAEL